MPEPVRGDQKYLPGLDGLRALAVTAVVLYHVGLGWAQGGLLGVGVFFTLSGYLITDILLGQWTSGGRLRLGDFWLRRARRLLPALFVMLAVVAVWVNAFARAQLPGFRGDVVASALYVSNWWYIAQHASYYAQFAPPGPLDHLWSLAVEEQFYLIWPWLVLFGVWLLGRRRRGGGAASLAGRPPGYLSAGARWWFAGGTLALAAVSAVLMWALYKPGLDPTRVYEGTDTRAFGLLIGAALAAVWPTRGAAPVPPRARWLVEAGGVAGLAVAGLLVWRTNQYSPFMFQGGMVVLSFATALVVAAVAMPGSLLGRALGIQPLRWLGVRSYGVYLWHYPIIVLATPAAVLGGWLGWPRAVACAAASVVVAAVSWKFVEEPARRGLRRRGREERVVTRPRPSAWPGSAWTGVRRRAVASPVIFGGVCAVVAVGVAAGVTLVPSRLANGVVPAAATADPDVAAASTATVNATAVASAAAIANAAARQPAPATPLKPAASAQAAAPAPRTSCTSVVHIGDSTSEGLISSDYLPNPAERITARYADIGITRSVIKIVGGTSIVETLVGTQNAYQMAQQLIDSGYHGCWVLALGTNDTADVYAGSGVGRVERVKKMMALIGSQPVLWIEVKSLVSSGPYAEQNMKLWNQALEQEAPHYPNMRLYDWPAVVQNSWFINDGIHYTSYGYAQRARLIAGALAAAFPASPA